VFACVCVCVCVCMFLVCLCVCLFACMLFVRFFLLVSVLARLFDLPVPSNAKIIEVQMQFTINGAIVRAANGF